MPQVQLPIFPSGSVEINNDLACRCEEENVVYYNGHLPVFMHARSDLASFRLFTSQLIVQGSATQGDVARAFGVPLISIKRATKLYRLRGAAGFFVPGQRREGTRLTDEKLEQARALILQGEPLAVVSRQTGVLTDTLRKAMGAGRLPALKKKSNEQACSVKPAFPAPCLSSSVLATGPTTLSQRSVADSLAPMGYATTRSLDRMLSACGLLTSAPLEFLCADDVPAGGVLCALPALLSEGLLRHTRTHYQLPRGFYPLESLFLLLALLALARCRSLEQVRYQAPGEWGKLLGLDRLPEVKTLRAKIGLLCDQEGKAASWQSQLAKDWMAAAGSESQNPQENAAGLFYTDGHVRVYHGHLTPLPRRYVARQRLCLRATTDYWVNGLGGEPFFMVTMPVNPGLIAVLREKIVPQLLIDAPQPGTEVLEADPHAVRFTIIFDREGYSPDFFAEMKKQRIAVLTYHKFPGEKWPAEEFSTQSVKLHTGEVVDLKLAERGTCLSNGLWVREVRELNADGGQSSILCTNYKLDLTRIAALMGARWSQENFLKYMRENFGLDRLIEHGTTPLPETTMVINPAYRRLDQQVRRERAQLQRLQVKFGSHLLPAEPTPEQTQQFEARGGELREKIQQQEGLFQERKAERRKTPHKLTLKELPEAERFQQLCPESKHFIDTVKMIAYRAESAMAGEVREHLAREDDARALLRRLFLTPVNLRPDPAAGTLTVEIHRMGSPLQDAAIAQLCKFLTETETTFPTTSLRLIYSQVGSG